MKSIEQLTTLTTKQLALGIGIGLLVSVLSVTLFFSVALGYPVGVEPYQYDYPNGTNPVTPLTQDSVNIHGSGVALSNAAYTVTYTETNTYLYDEKPDETYKNTTITYQINNRDGGQGYMERNSQTTNPTTGEVNETETYIYENNSYAFVHNNLQNTTSWSETGNTPLVITNQLELPQQLVLAVPQISWRPLGTQERDGTTVFVYDAVNANANQMTAFESVSTVNGELLVNTKTGVMTYNTTIVGTTPTGQTVQKQQSLTYTALDNDTYPETPSWATRNESSQTQDDDDEWDAPY